MAAAVGGQGVTCSCDPNFKIAQVGLIARWTTIKNLTFSGDVSGPRLTGTCRA
jgi:hypothetical protein